MSLAVNLSWSMDFVSDGLADGRKLRCLNIVDDCTRECLAIEVDTSITGARVKTVMQRLADNGSAQNPQISGSLQWLQSALYVGHSESRGIDELNTH